MPHPDLGITYKLDFKKTTRLVDALLKCPIMKSRQGRDSVINELGDIGTNVKRSDAAKEDVMNIVRACENRTKGIDTLLNIVKWYEGSSTAIRRLEEVE